VIGIPCCCSIRPTTSPIQQGYEPKTLTMAATIDVLSPATLQHAVAVQDSGPLSEEAFARLWMMGMTSERALGRPKDWDGRDEGFDAFAFKFANWLSGMPGRVEELLEAAACEKEPISTAVFGHRTAIMAAGVNQALRSLVEGKALDIVKQVPEKGNGFEAWRRLWAEYRPLNANRKVSLLERVMDERPSSSEDFSSWYFRWLELIRQTEMVRQRPLDDDIKCAVVLKRAPPELRDHLVLQAGAIADTFSTMNQIITTWMIARRSFPPTGLMKQSKEPAGMEVSAVWQDKGKGKGKGKPKGFFGKGSWSKDGGKSYAGSWSKGFGKKGKGKAKGKEKGWRPPWAWSAGSAGYWPRPPTVVSYAGPPEVFHGYCGGCWQWGHKKAQCPSRPAKMDIGGMVSTSAVSTAVGSEAYGMSDPGTSVSAKVAAVAAREPELNDEDWPDSWPWCSPEDWWCCQGEPSEWFQWEPSLEPGWSEDWAEESTEEGQCVCAIAQQAKEENGTGYEELMIDSGSQSTSCKPDFAADYQVDDTDCARLWDIQDRQIAAYGKKVVDVEFVGQVEEPSVPGRLRIDVSEVGKNVAAMGRLLRAGFDLHFTKGGHESWMERDGARTTLFEDDPASEAPLFYMRVRVLPTPASRREPGLIVAPLAAEVEILEQGCEVQLAGLVREGCLNG